MKIVTTFFILFIIIFVLFKSNAQNSVADSLENLISLHENNDTTRVNLLNNVANRFRSIDLEKTLEYAKKLKKLQIRLIIQKEKQKAYV